MKTLNLFIIFFIIFSEAKAQTPYHNLGKYWWYRYKLVNDFMLMGPDADEVKKDGIDLGNMDAKLLQKIEELTLYVIQQQKEIDELKKQSQTKK